MENEWSIFKQKANILFTRRNLTAAFSMYSKSINNLETLEALGTTSVNNLEVELSRIYANRCLMQTKMAETLESGQTHKLKDENDNENHLDRDALLAGALGDAKKNVLNSHLPGVRLNFVLSIVTYLWMTLKRRAAIYRHCY